MLRLDRRRGARVALGELTLEVGERGGSALLEGHRLLDLEVDGHPAVLGAAVVLDGHEVEEAHELAGAASLLLAREGRGREPVERLCHLGPRRREGLAVAAQGAARQACEGGRGLLGGRGAAVALVLGFEQRPEPGRLGGALRPAGAEAALGGVVGLGEAVAQAGLVGVEQVLAHVEGHLARALAPACERADGQRGVHAGTGEAGGLAKLAQEEPARGPGSVTRAHRGQGRLVGAAQQRGAQPAACGGESDLVAGATRPLGGGQRGERVPSRAGRIAAQATVERSAQLTPRAAHQRLRGAALVEKKRGLGLEDEVLRALRRLPWRGRLGRGQRSCEQDYRRQECQ